MIQKCSKFEITKVSQTLRPLVLHRDYGIMIKGAGAFQDRLNKMGCTRWSYTRDTGKTTQMPYWRLPDSAQDDPNEATALALEALRYL